MHTPHLIVITGESGTGKSTLGAQLAKRYQCLFVSKDALKERMFNALGTDDKTWSRKVSTASHRIMDDLIEQALALGQAIIVESNFKSHIDSERFTKLIQKHHAGCTQILCKADGDILFDRWNKRIQAGQRHAGHVEEVGLEQIKQDLARPYPPLQLPGTLVEIDTTDFNKVQLPEL